MVTMTIEERQRRERELHSRLRVLVAEGLTLNAMEQRSGLSRSEHLSGDRDGQLHTSGLRR